MKIYTFEVGQMKANCYVVVDEKSHECFVIDPGDDGQYLVSKLTEIGIKPQALIATHGHMDHVMAAYELQHIYSIGFFIHPDDVFLLDRMERSAKHFLHIRQTCPPPHVDGNLMDSDEITIGTSKGSVVSLPGHTPGSIGIWFPEERVFFTGDTIFAGGQVGRTDYAYSDKTKFIDSIRKVFNLPDDTLLYPGHGEPSSVSEERMLRDDPMI
jgi:hydroxyacylglutathione hydrolase